MTDAQSAKSASISDASSSVASKDNKSQNEKDNVGPEVSSDMQHLEILQGIYGFLFAWSKETYCTGFVFALLLFITEFTQLFELSFTLSSGYAIDENLWLWKAISCLSLEQLFTTRGYAFYTAVFYILLVLLYGAVFLSAYTAWTHKNRNVSVNWPLFYLRVFPILFFRYFDIASLTLIETSFSCQPKALGHFHSNAGHLRMFPAESCKRTPQSAHLAIGIISLFVFVLYAMLLLAANFKMSLVFKGPTTVSNSGVLVTSFILKVLMTLVHEIMGWPKVKLIIHLVLCLYNFWIFFKWQPHLHGWVNHSRVAINGVMVWLTLMSIILAYHTGHYKAVEMEENHQYRKKFSILTLVGMIPVAFVCYAASYYWLKYYVYYIPRKFREAEPGTRPKEIYRFRSPREVEITMRMVRKWVDDDQLDQEVVDEGEGLMKSVALMFPTNSAMLVLHSSFLIEVLGDKGKQAGYSLLQTAKKSDPGLMESYTIYMREQIHLQQDAENGGGNTGVDLVSYVEFQGVHRAVIRAHKESLLATRSFWQQLMSNHVTFNALNASLIKIEASHVEAERVYRMALQRYPESVKLVRNFAKFLETVKNDPWSASKFHEEAESMESALRDQENRLEIGEVREDKNNMLRVDDKRSAVVLINSAGIIQVANKASCELLGYTRDELEGKNCSIFITAPFAQKHNMYIRAYMTTGEEKVIGVINEVMVVHKDRYVFPIKLAVTRASSNSEDSTFMGAWEPMAVNPTEANAFMMASGSIIALDQAFIDFFGNNMDDLVGKTFQHLVQPEMTETVKETIDAAVAATPSELAEGKFGLQSVTVQHKYLDAVKVSVVFNVLRVAREVLIKATMVRLEAPSELMLLDHKGRFLHVTNSLANCLGHTPRTLRMKPVSDVMAQPFGMLHNSWIRNATSTDSAAAEQRPNTVLPGSCRSGLTMTLGTNAKMLQYFSLHISSTQTEDTNKLHHVVHLMSSDLHRGLDERRLRLQIDICGKVRQVLSTHTPARLFGFDVSELMGSNVMDFIDVFRTPLYPPNEALGAPSRWGSNATYSPVTSLTGSSAGPIQPGVVHAGSVFPVGRDGKVTAQSLLDNLSPLDILSTLVAQTTEHSNTSWRVGVSPPIASVELNKLGSMARKLLMQQTVATVMELEVQFTTGEEATEVMEEGFRNLKLLELLTQFYRTGVAPPENSITLHLNLWRADLLNCVMEVEHATGVIQSVHKDTLCPPGLVYGTTAKELEKRLLSSRLKMDGHDVVWLYSALKPTGMVAKSAMKNAQGYDSKKPGPVRIMRTAHQDGRPMYLSVQPVPVESISNRSFIVTKMAKAAKGDVRRCHKNTVALMERYGFKKVLQKAQLRALKDAAKPLRTHAQATTTATAAATTTVTVTATAIADDMISTVSLAPAAPATNGTDLKKASATDMFASLMEEADAPPPTQQGPGTPREPTPPRPPPPPFGAADGLLDLHNFGVTRNSRAQLSDPQLDVLLLPAPGAADAAAPAPGESNGGNGAGEELMKQKSNNTLDEMTSLDRRDTGDLFALDQDGMSAFASSPGERVMFGGTTELGPENGRSSKTCRNTGFKVLVDDYEGDDGSMLDGNHHPRGQATPRGSDSEEANDNIFDAVDEDAQSGMSGSAGDEGGAGAADFRRGKRFRRLSKMLNSTMVTSSMKILKQRSAYMAGIVVVLATMCFIIMFSTLQGGKRKVDFFARVGLAGFLAQKILVDLAALDNIHLGLVRDGVFTATSGAFYSSALLSHINAFKNNHVEIFKGIGTANMVLQDPYDNLDLLNIWNNPNFNQTTFFNQAVPPVVKNDRVKLWFMGNRFIDNALTVHEYHNAWADAGLRLRDQGEFQGAMTNGFSELYRGYYDTMNAVMLRSVESYKKINSVQLTLMVLVGLGCSIAVLVYMWYLLQRVQNQRYSLYNVFLVIPTVLVKNLSNKSIVIGEEQDSESEEEEEDAGAAGALAHAHMNLLETQLFSENGSPEKDGGDKVKKPLYKRLLEAVKEISESLTGANAVKNQMSQQLKGKKGKKSGKRVLVRNSFDSLLMIVPFFSFCIVMVTLSGIGYSKLSGTNSPLAVMNVVFSMLTRLQRVMLVSLKTCSSYPSTSQTALMQTLSSEIQNFRFEWDMLLYGTNSTVAGDAHYHGEQGITRSNAAAAHLLFRYDGCLTSLATHGHGVFPDYSYVSCFAAADEYYMAMNGGLAAAVDRFSLDASYILRSPANLLDMSNEHLLFVAGQAKDNIEAALNVLTKETAGDVHKVYDLVSQLHLLSFVLVVVLVVAFTLVMLRIYINRITSETQRIAKMLIQLPPELDIETLIMFSVLPPALAAKAMAKGRRKNESRSNGADGTERHESQELLHAGESRSTFNSFNS